jgi:GNAT superfamily N-acetyltransferase
VSDADRATALPVGTRRVRDEDAPALIDLIVAAYDEHPGCVLDLPGVDDDLPAPATTAARRGSPWWVVERGGELLASVGVGPLDADGNVELKRLYLAAAARGQGLATRLIDVVERHAAGHGATRVVLWSDTRFADAHHRYAVLGYVRQPETRQLHDPSHTTEYRFEKPIKPARPDTTVAWDGPSGRETASLTALPDGWVLTSDLPDLGAAVRVEVDGAWATRRAEVTVEGAAPRVLTADGAGTWWRGGEAAPSLAGAVDVDVEVTPLTNTLPIRRLRLAGTEDAEVRAAWVRVPGDGVEPLEQRYTDLGRGRWRYRALTGFEAEITVDDDGLVETYGEVWRRA